MSKIQKALLAWGIVIVVLGLVAYIFLFSPLFRIDTIEVNGNKLLSDEQICQNLHIEVGDNEILTALRDIFTNEMDVENMDPRIQKIDAYFSGTNRLVVIVEETDLIGYLYYQGTYLWLSGSGVVIHSGEPAESQGLTAPRLEGITVDDFNLGGKVSENAKEQFQAVTSIISTLKKQNMLNTIELINVRDLEDIVLETEDLTICLGANEKLSKKIKIYASFAEQMTTAHGVLHLESTDGQMYFEPTN